MLDCVRLSVSILDSRTCTVLLWSFLSMRSRYLWDYLFTVIEDATAVRSRYLLDYLFTMIRVGVATVCIPLYVHLPQCLFAVMHTCVLGKWNDT